MLLYVVAVFSSLPFFPQILPANIRTFGAGKTASQHGYRCPSAKTLQRTLYARIGVRHLQSTLMCILSVVSVGLDKYSPLIVTTKTYRDMFLNWFLRAIRGNFPRQGRNSQRTSTTSMISLLRARGGLRVVSREITKETIPGGSTTGFFVLKERLFRRYVRPEGTVDASFKNV